MTDTIRPVAIGFVFGAVAGIIVGAWYATGMEKLDVEEPAEAPGPAVQDPAGNPGSSAGSQTDRPEEAAALRARVAELEAALGKERIAAAVGPVHTFDELPDLHSPESVHEEMNGFDEWAKTQPAAWALRLAGLDCDEPPCLIHIEMAELDSEASMAAQAALNEHFFSLFEGGSSNVHMNTIDGRTHMVRFFSPGEEALRDDLDRGATLRIRALWDDLGAGED